VRRPSPRRGEETAPGPQLYAVYVYDQDIVWATDFTTDAILRFDPVTERFTALRLPDGAGSVRQLLGRPRQLWGAASDSDLLFVVRS
jgi:virginiamycin B lyase